MITLAPSVAATNWNFSPPASTTVTGVNVSYSQADKTITANSSNNGGNNNANWVFGAVTRYWVAPSPATGTQLPAGLIVQVEQQDFLYQQLLIQLYSMEAQPMTALSIPLHQ